MKTRFKQLFLKSVGSTNDEVKDRLENIPGEYVVISYHQTSGRGKGNRIWNTKPDRGIGMSFLLRKPDLETVSHYTALAAIAVVRMLKSYEVEAKIKWPNDVLVNGKKICGILCESSIISNEAAYVIVGIGININYKISDFPNGLSTTPTSMLIETGEEMDMDSIVQAIICEFTKVVDSFENNRSFHKELLEYSYLINKSCKFNENERIFTATVKSINLDNSLNILENGVERTIYSADIVQIS